MAALIEKLQPYLLSSTTALAGSLAVDAWSQDRLYAAQSEIVAKLHYETRVSARVDIQEGDEFEFQAIPLTSTQIVRVRFRDVGQLPPPSYFNTEPVLED